MLRLEVSQVLVGENEVEKDESPAHESKGVPFAVSEVFFVHLAVVGSRKEMEEESSAHLSTDAGVPLTNELLCKRRRAFPEPGARKTLLTQ